MQKTVIVLMASSSSVSRTRSSLNHIPEEILTDILLRLPSKSLIRFRCVCKSWRYLIGSSSFGRSHLNRNVEKRSNSYLIAYQHSSKDEPEFRRYQYSLFSNETFEPFLKLKHPLWTEQEFRIYGSSNGLVCISDQVLHQNSSICIWNPSIGKSRTLPNIEQRLPDTHRITLSFGFHPELNDYKVVRMVQQLKSSSQVEVYTLSTDSWKRINGVIPAWLNFSRQIIFRRAFSNGIVYWLFSKGSKDTIVLFDTGSEEFQQVTVPDAISSKSKVLRIQPCKESVCLLYYYREERRLKFDIWMMKQQSFEKLHTISSSTSGGEFVYWPLGISSIDNELVLEGAHTYKDERGVVIDQICFYNLESKQFKKTGIELPRISEKAYIYSFAYIESLVLLDG